VQDAILADPERAPHVDIIDIRYWCYTAIGDAYAPKGGKNLAPRQHLRQTRLKSGGFDAIVKAVREYRARFPFKAVTYYADMNCPSGRDGWAVLIGGGSIPDVRLPDELADVVPKLRADDRIVKDPGQWCLADDGDNYFIYSDIAGGTICARLPRAPNGYRTHWIDAKTGALTDGTSLTGGENNIPVKSQALWIERLMRD
jgi:hypothetical protein